MDTEDGKAFALTPDQYETLSLNMAEILRFVSEASLQLRYYRNGL